MEKDSKSLSRQDESGAVHPDKEVVLNQGGPRDKLQGCCLVGVWI